MSKKEELIHSAILDKLGIGMSIYNSDDILTVAGITKNEIDRIERLINDSTASVTRNSEE